MAQRPTNWTKLLAVSYIEVYKYEQNGDYDRAIKVCNKILHNYPDEVLAFVCKVVCFIHLGKFEEALHFMKNSPHSKELFFEKAYCLYRCNKPVEALKILDEQEELSDKMKELKAQILYRLEKFNEAFQIYQELSENNDDYDEERQTNMGASLVYSEVEKIRTSIDTIRDDTYELCYNKACLFISLKQFSEAERKLRQSEKLCREALEEDGLSEEDIEVELAHIKIQLAYVYQKLGRTREAKQLYVTNLKLKLEDIALAAVASNNVIILNKDQNVFDSKRKMKIATNEQLNHKLITNQRKFVFLNRAMFCYYTHQYDACKKYCNSIEGFWPHMTVYTSVIYALLLVKEEQYDEALELLQKCKPENDEEKLQIQLVCVHFWLMKGDRLKACEALEDTGVNRYRPGIVGALITLYSAEGKDDIAKKIYKDTVEWYRENKNTEADLTNLWKQAAEFHLRSGQAQVAASSLEELLKINPSDKRALGKLIIAYSEFHKETAITLAEGLFKKEEIYKDIDTENVESSAWLSAKRTPANSSPAISATSSETSLIIKKKKPRNRKGKLPPNCDPQVPPDPERWLPKYERTGYRKKRDRRAKEVIKGSQGTASGQAELFDFSSKMANESDSHDSPTLEATSSVTKHQQKTKGQKKKSKRR